MFKNIKGLFFLIQSDLYRVGGSNSFGKFLKEFLFNKGFQYCVWMRVCSCFHGSRLGPFAFAYYPARLMLYRCTIKYGIDIRYETQIGSGFYIGHSGGIVVNDGAVIGKNCNISQGVTIGKTNRGNAGVPVIGDNVYIGPGAKIIGKIRVGNDVAIGANSVVTKDVPDHAVVMGIPARIISMQGSDGYVNHINYPPLPSGS